MDSQKIADLLRTGRTALGLSVPAVVERTRIKRSYIEAMESGNFTVFNSASYIRNFVRTYARFLKISESKIMPLLGDEAPPAVEVKVEPAALYPSPADPLTDGSRRKVSYGLLAGALVAAIAGLILVYTTQAGKKAVPPQEAGRSRADGMEGTDTQAGSTGADQLLAAETSPVSATAPPTSRPHRAEMTAVTEVWMSWESESDRLQKLLRAGDRQVAPFEKNLRLIVGNPSGLRLTIDGMDISIDTGRVFDRIFREDEAGRIVIEPATSGALRRFQTGQP